MIMIKTVITKITAITCLSGLLMVANLPLFNAFEAHVISVTAKIQNRTLINKVYFNVDSDHGTEYDNEWIELYNTSSSEINIENWEICDNNECDVLSTEELLIPGNGYAVITYKESTWDYWDIPDGVIKIVLGERIGNGLSNTADMLLLKNEKGRIIDQMNWGTPDINNSNPANDWWNGYYNDSLWNPGADEGGDGDILGRDPNGYDTDRVTDWKIFELPDVTVLIPNGGEEWYFKGDYDITWSALNNNGDDLDLSIDIYFSNDSGVTWANIVMGEENDGVYEWENIPYYLPYDLPDGSIGYYSLESSNARIKVVATDYTRNFMLSNWDMSDYDFCPPIDCGSLTPEEMEFLIMIGILDESRCSVGSVGASASANIDTDVDIDVDANDASDDTNSIGDNIDTGADADINTDDSESGDDTTTTDDIVAGGEDDAKNEEEIMETADEDEEDNEDNDNEENEEEYDEEEYNAASESDDSGGSEYSGESGGDDNDKILGDNPVIVTDPNIDTGADADINTDDSESGDDTTTTDDIVAGGEDDAKNEEEIMETADEDEEDNEDNDNEENEEEYNAASESDDSGGSEYSGESGGDAGSGESLEDETDGAGEDLNDGGAAGGEDADEDSADDTGEDTVDNPGDKLGKEDLSDGKETESSDGDGGGDDNDKILGDNPAIVTDPDDNAVGAAADDSDDSDDSGGGNSDNPTTDGDASADDGATNGADASGGDGLSIESDGLATKVEFSLSPLV